MEYNCAKSNILSSNNNKQLSINAQLFAIIAAVIACGGAGRPVGPMFINLLLPNYPLLQIKNNSVAAANRLFLPKHLFVLIKAFDKILHPFKAIFWIK
ncbi:MAG: hypothetical protein EAZ32_13325 [Cytophagia bacterium]|nr:MAG: hypothetical protein EAZ38_14365 [Cytophagales bacterium]TAG38149.1 MAG: hypothetical protein EAZ32_13325 [Cytophagia bacterium]TAG79581.1 MAG: hypothetical protein EAZ22_11320 [Cytophagales bacterium]